MASATNTTDGGCTLRCSVEKRTMCRDLQKWSKTLLCMIGLENVAERLAARKKLVPREGQQFVHISPFVEPVLLSPSSSSDSHRNVVDKHGLSSEGASKLDCVEDRTPLPQDWDPKERCAICIQISEKEEFAKKAQQTAAAASSQSQQHSRTKRELRADRAKEASDSKTAGRNSDHGATMPAGSSQCTIQQQSLLSPNKQQQQSHQLQSHLQHMLDWRSLSGSASATNAGNVFAAMNMFRGGAQSSSTSAYNSASHLAASMFTPTGYPFFDLNQVYLNELLNQYNKLTPTGVTGGSGSTSYSMMPSLPLGTSSMTPPHLTYSMGAGFSFPHLVANLGGQVPQVVGQNLFEEPLDLSRKQNAMKSSTSAVQTPGGSVPVNDALKTNTVSSNSATAGPSQSPLGLSDKGPASNASSNGSSSSGANKRTYSQADLQAAVHDIRSKKLGTRRASVVYGIPRSTLRNKIYKLEATDDDQAQAAVSAVDVSCSSPAASTSSTPRRRRKRDEAKKMAALAVGTEDQKLAELSSPQPSCVPLLSSGHDPICGRATTSPDDSSASLSSTSTSSSCVNESNTFSYSEAYIANWTTSATLTAELAKRQALEMLWRTAESNGASAPVFSKEASSYSSPIANGSTAVKTALQDAVCCALAENLKLRCGTSGASVDSSGSPLSLVSVLPKSNSNRKRSSSRRRGASTKNSKSLLDSKSPATMVKLERPAQSGSTGGASSNAEDGGGDGTKKVRPKRGQYRKYDKNALAEAVHAVRRGEMSVHRAGSYYGVPHSTLEYKVKERNLLRPKKRDLKKKLEESANTESAATSACASASASALPATSLSEVAKLLDASSDDQATTSAKAKPESNKQSKSKRAKRQTQGILSPLSSGQTASPVPSDIFASLTPGTSTSDLLAPAVESSAKLGEKSIAATATPPPAAGASSALDSSASDALQLSEGSTAAGETGEFNTLKAYEAGFQAALLSATGLWHQLQIQNYASSNGNTDGESEFDGDNASQTQNQSQLAATSD